jgi:hypothetical protein
MIGAITSATNLNPTAATESQPAAKSATASPKAAQSQPNSTASAATDTVHISSAAQLAIQEAIENPAQTAAEANKGDHQAQRLLAREAADKIG